MLTEATLDEGPFEVDPFAALFTRIYLREKAASSAVIDVRTIRLTAIGAAKAAEHARRRHDLEPTASYGATRRAYAVLRDLAATAEQLKENPSVVAAFASQYKEAEHLFDVKITGVIEGDMSKYEQALKDDFAPTLYDFESAFADVAALGQRIKMLLAAYPLPKKPTLGALDVQKFAFVSEALMRWERITLCTAPSSRAGPIPRFLAAAWRDVGFRSDPDEDIEHSLGRYAERIVAEWARRRRETQMHFLQNRNQYGD